MVTGAAQGLGRAIAESLAGAGASVVLADVTSVWKEVLRRKKFADLSGNGVNHPNDFGHRIYTEVILSLLITPDE